MYVHWRLGTVSACYCTAVNREGQQKQFTELLCDRMVFYLFASTLRCENSSCLLMHTLKKSKILPRLLAEQCLDIVPFLATGTPTPTPPDSSTSVFCRNIMLSLTTAMSVLAGEQAKVLHNKRIMQSTCEVSG